MQEMLQDPLFWVPSIVVGVLILVFLVYLTIRAHRAGVGTGVQGMVGEEGVYRGNGLVFVHGELWEVSDAVALSEGDRVIVEGVERMALRVRRLT